MTEKKVVKNNDTSKVNIIKVKDSLYYDVDIPSEIFEDVKKSLKNGDIVKQDQEIELAVKEPDSINVEYQGAVRVKEGQEVFAGDTLAAKKKWLIQKEKTLSPVNGTIEKIDEMDITIKPVSDLTKGAVKIRIPFNGKVKAVTQNQKLLMEFPGVQFKLFAAKGESTVGKLHYVDGEKLRDKKNPPRDLSGSIIFTDAISPEVYPKLTTLGVKGIIVNSINYSLYSEIIILAVPIGIFMSFGKQEEDKSIGIDAKISKYLQSKEGETVWFDAAHNRLVIPDDSPQAWMKKYVLDLKEEKIVV